MAITFTGSKKSKYNSYGISKYLLKCLTAHLRISLIKPYCSLLMSDKIAI